MTTSTPTDNDRMTRIEGAFEQMNKRLDDIQGHNILFRQETREGFEALRKDMQTGDEALRQQIERLGARINVMIGLLWASMFAGFIAMFVAILTLPN